MTGNVLESIGRLLQPGGRSIAAPLARSSRLADRTRAIALVLLLSTAFVVAPSAPSQAACLQPLRWGGHVNGKIPTDQLSAVSWASGHRVYPPGATALERLNFAYRERFGTNIAITDSYRTYAQQVTTKAAKGDLAATPGCSNHGWARALDLGGGINRFGTVQYAWMRANAPSYGWVAPGWARSDGSKPEAWHWEFASGSGTSAGADPDPAPAPPPPADPVRSTLVNGSFENGATGWHHSAPANIGHYSEATGYGPNGYLATNSGGFIYSDPASVSAAIGDVVEGVIWLKAEIGVSTGSVCVEGSSEPDCTRYSVGTTWTRVDVRLGAHSPQANARLSVWSDPTSPTVFMDNASLTKYSTLGNGSFENGATGWHPSAPANIGYYSENATYGTNSYLATNSGGFIYGDPVSVNAAIGDVVEGVIWLKAEIGVSTGSVCVEGSSEPNCTRYSVGTTWTRVDVRLGAHSPQASVRLSVWSDPTAPTVFMDNASLTKYSTLGNGSFENGATGWHHSAPANIGHYSEATGYGPNGYLATNSGGFIYTDPVSVNAAIGDVVEGVIWLKAEIGVSTGSVCVEGSSEPNCTRYSVGATWTRVDVRLGAHSPQANARLSVWSDATAPTVFMDNASLRLQVI